MKQRRILFVFLLMILAASGWRAAAQQAGSSTNPVVTADRQILTEIKDHSEVMPNLEYLTDIIGPRLTGSPNLTRANQWTAEMFRKYGLSNVHLEPWTIARSWTRGAARGRIISPTDRPLTLASAGWSPSTNGAVRGPVMYVKARRSEELAEYKGKLKGAIVIATEPDKLPPPYEVPRSPVLSPFGPPPEAQLFGPAAQRFRDERDAFFKAEGAAAVLRDSGKDHGLLNMGGIGGEHYNVGALPTAFVTHEGYSQIWRLLDRGPVQVEVELTNSFGEKPMEVYNTVAEIRGSEKPNEVVVLGAHLDSWDLGTGATDNGTGSMAVLEAARALAKLNVKPERTIRFILFTGEEQGLVGSKMYVQAHKADLGTISAVLVHDTGTGRVLSIGLQGNYQDREVMDKLVAPMREVGLLELSQRSIRGTDHASFNDAGVPGFYCIQDPAEYRKTHHSQSDTFDKVWKDDLVQGAQVLAAWAYNAANAPEMLPRKPVEKQAGNE